MPDLQAIATQLQREHPHAQLLGVVALKDALQEDAGLLAKKVRSENP